MSEELRVCVDRMPTARQEYEAAEFSKIEREGNSPHPERVAGILESLGDLAESPHLHRDDVRRAALVMLTKSRLANGRTILVYFMDGPEWAHDKAMYYFKRWESHANLRLVQTKDRQASDWRVTFEPGGSWSYLGTTCFVIPKDEPTMQLGWLLRKPDDDEEWRRVCVHESGHGIDFVHEQAHPRREFEWNKPAVYDLYGGPPNNWSEAQIDRQVIFKYSELVTNFSAYNKFSIMHYPIPAALVIDPADAVPWNSSRSRMDKQYSALWYPKPSTAAALERLVDELEEAVS